MIDSEKIKILQLKIALHEDHSAFNELYVECLPSLIRFAYSFIKSREQAEEIASDVMLQVWNRRAQLCGVADFRLYLYVSTRNTALNYLKKQQREVVVSVEEPALWMKAADATPEQLLITAELLKKIQLAIQQLPPQCRLIYKLIKEDGLKYKQTAELLELSVKTIETQMGIAMKRLYEVFRNSFQEPATSVSRNPPKR